LKIKEGGKVAEIRTGVALWSQATSWQEMLEAAKRIDNLGYDSLFADDHLYADAGDAYQPKLEAWTLLAAWAVATQRVKLGHYVLANTFRNPGLVVKMATTVDHIAQGRVILGIGAGWFELEHHAFGLDFGASAGERLDWLDESAAIMRRLLDGETVTHEGARYVTRELRVNPLPVQERLPILIGGAGERKTLRTVARYADMWHLYTPPIDVLEHKLAVLHAHCAAVDRDSAEIELTITPAMTLIRDDAADARRAYADLLRHNRIDDIDGALSRRAPWFGSPAQLAERLAPYVQLGFRHIIIDTPAPFDTETIERFISEVKPLLEQL
jgi:alkanesulfonate monooxygenase SsuD/methylene tetrahydromethanopterin reductase-like flavin-dependent oxidoreductase (luciferase family)